MKKLIDKKAKAIKKLENLSRKFVKESSETKKEIHEICEEMKQEKRNENL